MLTEINNKTNAATKQIFEITDQPQILLLKEGTDTSQGKGQIISNINACTAVVNTIKTTLGPRGMDKLIASKNGSVTISNDGATIMKLLEIIHPAASILVEIAKAQDAEVGDGTTSVVLLAGEFLREAKSFIEEGMHPQIIISSYRMANAMAMKFIEEIAIPVSRFNISTSKGENIESDALRSLLEKCASTSMNSKLVGSHKEFFTKMVVDAVLRVKNVETGDYPLESIGIKKVAGGSMRESLLIDGVAFKKTFSYAGFEMQPKQYTRAKIAVLNIELELKAERDNAEIRVDSVEEYQRIVDAEWTILYNKLDVIVASGVNIVLSKLPIGDVATQYFADRDIFCAGRVAEDDIGRTIKSCGGRVLSSIADGIPEESLGFCHKFEEIQIGDDRFNIFKTVLPTTTDSSESDSHVVQSSKSVTLILRGGAEQFIAETERSLHDAIMVVRRLCKTSDVVAGGGAIEMALSKHLREESKKIAGKPQILIARFAKALEVIPRQLCDNAGLDSTNILNLLRNKHFKNEYHYGVDIMRENVANNLEKFVLEPKVLKINALTAATEACCSILSIDETITHPKNKESGQNAGGR